MGARTSVSIIALGMALLTGPGTFSAQPIKSLPRKPAVQQPSTPAQPATQPAGKTLPFEVQEISVEGLAQGGLLPVDRLESTHELRLNVKNTSGKQVAYTATLQLRLLRHGAPAGVHLILQQPVQITLNPNAFQMVSVPFVPGQIPDLGFTTVAVDIRWTFTNLKTISWGSTNQGTPAAMATVPAGVKAQAALSQAATQSLDLMEADWKTQTSLFRTSWPTPQLTTASPDAVTAGETVSLAGSGFGAAQGSRQVALVPADGGPPVLPQVLSWSDKTLQVRAPQGTGSYRLALANLSLSSVVPGPTVLLGVKKMDVVLDLMSLYDGTGFRTYESDPNLKPTSAIPPSIIIGPKGAAGSWRSRHLGDLPTILFGGAKTYVLKREWNQDKNTFYDITAKHYLAFFGETQSLSWDGDMLTFTVPIKGHVKELFTWYLYNLDKEVPYEHVGSYVCTSDQQTMIIRTRLAVQAGGAQGRHRLYSIAAECSPMTLTFTFPPQPKAGNAYTRTFTDAWEASKPLIPAMVAKHFLDPSVSSGVFGVELTGEIEKRIGPGRDVLRVVGRGGSKVTVYFQEK